MTARKKTKPPRPRTPVERFEIWELLATAFARAEMDFDDFLVRLAALEAAEAQAEERDRPREV